MSLLLQQVQPEGQPQPAHEGQARGDGHQPGQPRWVQAGRQGPSCELPAGPCHATSGKRPSVNSGSGDTQGTLSCLSCQHAVVAHTVSPAKHPSAMERYQVGAGVNLINLVQIQVNKLHNEIRQNKQLLGESLRLRHGARTVPSGATVTVILVKGLCRVGEVNPAAFAQVPPLHPPTGTPGGTGMLLPQVSAQHGCRLVLWQEAPDVVEVETSPGCFIPSASPAAQFPPHVHRDHPPFLPVSSHLTPGRAFAGDLSLPWRVAGDPLSREAPVVPQPELLGGFGLRT